MPTKTTRKRRQRKLLEVQIGDTLYEVDAAYRAGAKAGSDGTSYHANPHRFGSYAYDQWSSGHCHEDDPETTLTALGVSEAAAKT